MASVTDQTRRAVWVTLCDLEYNRRYYTALGDRYRSCHRRLRFGILASVPVEGAILYAATDYAWLFIPAIMIGIVLAALTVWDAISNYAEDAAVLRLTAFICDDLKQDSEELWRKVENDMVDTAEAEAMNRSIIDRWGAATQRVQPGTHQKLNDLTSREANQDVESRYAV